MTKIEYDWWWVPPALVMMLFMSAFLVCSGMRCEVRVVNTPTSDNGRK